MSPLHYIKIIVNFKFRHIYRAFGQKSFALLDVGTGNHSASRLTRLFPNCSYYGLDIDKNYNNNEADFACMTEFYETDLTKLDYAHIPDSFFDGICMAHVIEHLYNGDEVVALLVNKLKPGGYFYVEYPGKKSLRLPSMKGSLNFKDDPTHVRIYSVAELRKIFESKNCAVLAGRTRRNWFYIIAMPLRAILSLIKRGHVQGNVLWDVMGFAEYLWVQKKLPGQS
ncbi:MAG TPA: methyltransferase domain-containing protein [Chitinophagaceae bacterium]|jgi:SAM-dependent methyltransferase|nr:methyltransferase domain-containing protein [Chitinophagaceae bacterium]